MLSHTAVSSDQAMARRKHSSIDRTDRRILRILEMDGRIANVELARQVNLSPTPCLERVRRLEREGVITGYAARLAPDRVSRGMTVFVEVRLDHTTAQAFDNFRSAVDALADVIDCYLVAGDFDYLLKLQVADVADYRLFMYESLPKLPDVLHTRSYIVVEQLKGNAPLIRV